MPQPPDKFNLLSFTGRFRTLHLTWFAFFISFMVWFAHAPLMVSISKTLSLSNQEINVLLILNLALTIPARVVVGMLVDKLGPRIMFSSILIIGGIISILFALAQNYHQLAMARFALGFVGAGFVVGIRMITEWFPAKETGLAQGIYGGWGNFGSAGAALLLPSIALVLGGDDGWRYAIGLTGIIAIIYGVLYYFLVSNTPRGSTYFKPKKMGAMEVTSVGDLVLYLLMSLPMYAALAVLNWKLSPAVLGWLDGTVSTVIYLFLAGLYVLQSYKIISINKSIFSVPIPKLHRYAFAQVVALDLAYMVTFGAELALVSMLPLFYVNYFGTSLVLAGILAGLFPVINLVARPAGGYFSDKFGRRLTMLIVFTGITGAFLLMGQVTKEWALPLVVATTILAGIFAKAGSGAVYSIVPLVQRRFTGQIAGMVGAYGNVGGVIFLTVLSFYDPHTLFLTIAATAGVTLLFVFFMLKEPKGQMAEVMEDGTVQMISVEK